jgi:hypothetical protein
LMPPASKTCIIIEVPDLGTPETIVIKGRAIANS